MASGGRQVAGPDQAGRPSCPSPRAAGKGVRLGVGSASCPQDARSHTPPCPVRRLCQARLRQVGEQYVAETGRSTPTVQAVPHSGQLDVTPAFTASVLARARRICRQCLDRHSDEQNTAVAFTPGISGPPHPRHSRGPMSPSATTISLSRGTPSLPIRAPYEEVPVVGVPHHDASHGSSRSSSEPGRRCP